MCVIAISQSFLVGIVATVLCLPLLVCVRENPLAAVNVNGQANNNHEIQAASGLLYYYPSFDVDV